MRILIASVLFLFLSACKGGGGEDDASTIVAPVQSTCVAGDTVVNIPPDAEELADEIIEDAQDEGSEVKTEEVPVFDNSGALRLGLKITIIGNCNDVHTEDNDVTSDDDTNFQVGQQEQ